MAASTTPSPEPSQSHYTPIYAMVLSWLPRAAFKFPTRRPFLFLCVRIGALLGLFVLMDRFMMRAGRLPATAYEQPHLAVALLERLGAPLLLCMAALGLVLARYGSLLIRWNSMNLGQQLRWFVVFLAVLMAWPFTTYGYNYYFDQGHYIDRVLIAILVPLIWLRPVFIYPFLLLIFATMWQLGEPSLGGSIFAHKLQVLHVLNLFAAAFLVHAVTGSRRADTFLFLTCCLVAAAYWQAALAKIEIGWFTHGHLYLMPLAAYAHGWLAFLEPSAVVALARVISWVDWPMVVFVLVIEAGALLFLWHRSVSIGLLVAVMVFHLGVFALYGFLFWTWILLDAALLVLLVRDWKVRRIAIYSRGHLLISVLLIGFASAWAKPPHLGWFDTRLSYTYRLEGIGVSGQQFALPPRFFAPYEDVFTMASFAYLVKDHRVLTGPYGVMKDRDLTGAVMAATTPEEIFALESNAGARRYDPRRAARFYEFVSSYVTNRNLRGEKAAALYMLHPPRQFWSFDRGELYADQEPIREVLVTEVTTLFDDKRLEVIREIELARLTISADQTAKVAGQ